MADNSKGFLRGLFKWGGSSPLPTKNGQVDLSDLIGVGSGGESLEASYYERMRIPYGREEMYKLYDELDEMAEVAGVLTAYAEDATQHNLEKDESVWIEASNKDVKKELTKLFYDVLEVEDWLLPATREAAKYGDEFARLKWKEKEGITGIADWPFPHNVKRLETKDGVLVGFLDQAMVEDKASRDSILKSILKPWDMVHFRLRAHNRMPRNLDRWVYGTSQLFPIRRSGRRLLLYSDLLFLYRLRNSFDRKIFYVDTGSEDMAQAVKILKKWKRAVEKREYINENELMYKISHNPLSLGENTFWPKRPNSQSGIEVIQGNADVSAMADIDREENALFAGLRAPKEYFGFGSEGGMFDRDKGLTLKDMRWGRSVAHLQRAMKLGLHRIASIHLALKGINPLEKKNWFTIKMVPPSTLEYMQEIEAKSNLAGFAEAYYQMGDTMQLNPDEWRKHVMSDLMGFSNADIKKFTRDADAEPDPEGNAAPGDEPAAKESIQDSISRESHKVLPKNGQKFTTHKKLAEWLNSPDAGKFLDSIVEKAPKTDTEPAEDDVDSE